MDVYYRNDTQNHLKKISSKYKQQPLKESIGESIGINIMKTEQKAAQGNLSLRYHAPDIQPHHFNQLQSAHKSVKSMLFHNQDRCG
jgi:hypothetical protein